MCLWGDWISVVYYDFSLRRSFTRPISALLTVVYSSGPCLVLKGRRRDRRDSLSTMEIYVDTIDAFM